MSVMVTSGIYGWCAGDVPWLKCGGGLGVNVIVKEPS